MKDICLEHVLEEVKELIETNEKDLLTPAILSIEGVLDFEWYRKWLYAFCPVWEYFISFKEANPTFYSLQDNRVNCSFCEYFQRMGFLQKCVLEHLNRRDFESVLLKTNRAASFLKEGGNSQKTLFSYNALLYKGLNEGSWVFEGVRALVEIPESKIGNDPKYRLFADTVDEIIANCIEAKNQILPVKKRGR